MSEHAAQTIPCPSCGMALGRHVNAEGHDACTCGWDSAGFELMIPPEPLLEFLPSIRTFQPVNSSSEDFEACTVCHDPECSGACPWAVYVVRQVMEALDGEDDRVWWRDYFDLPQEPPC